MMQTQDTNHGTERAPARSILPSCFVGSCSGKSAGIRLMCIAQTMVVPCFKMRIFQVLYRDSSWPWTYYFMFILSYTYIVLHIKLICGVIRHLVRYL